jgi:hypothetical protein
LSFLLFVGDIGFMCDGIMNFNGWHSWVDVSSIVTLVVIHSKMNRCLSSFVNTVKTAFTDAIMMWFTLMSLFFWNVAPHIIGWLCLTLRNRTLRNSAWTFQPLKIRISCCLKMLGVNHPVTRHHIAEEQNLNSTAAKAWKLAGFLLFFYVIVSHALLTRTAELFGYRAFLHQTLYIFSCASGMQMRSTFTLVSFAASVGNFP